MKIVILGPAYPYRGGLATIMHTMAREYMSRGHDVRIYTFTVQYPSLLFPGKTQYVEGPAPEDLQIERVMSTVNPINWVQLGLRLKHEAPDMVVMKYWTPFMAPCFGTIARIARQNGVTKFICQIDNVEPHEHHIIDKPFNKYYLRAVDGFVYMSEQVHGELQAYTSAPAIFSPHPMFENFGKAVNREDACEKLGLDCNCDYTLFFGLIRDYKGLDLLLEAWAQWMPDNRKLLIAGEFYASKERYYEIIERCGLQDRVVMHEGFVADDDVRYYFSVSDCLALPYRTATQSGVTQIAYNFSLPMLVTNVGGLPEIVPDGVVGVVCQPDVKGILNGLQRIYSDRVLDGFKANFEQERRRFSWSAMCDKLLEVYQMVK